jgi:hypothetical protein
MRGLGMAPDVFTANGACLRRVLPNLFDLDIGQALRIENKPYMTLHVDVLGRHDRLHGTEIIVALAHYGAPRNGDAMCDPDMGIRVTQNTNGDWTAEALHYQNAYAGVYAASFDADGRRLVGHAENQRFLATWTRDLIEQGFRFTHPGQVAA